MSRTVRLKTNTNSCLLDQQLLHFFKFLKSTLLIVLLKAGKLVKPTEVGRLFHVLMTLLVTKFIPTVQSLRGIDNLYACLSEHVVVICCNNVRISYLEAYFVSILDYDRNRSRV